MMVAEKNRYKNGDVYPTLRHKVVPNAKNRPKHKFAQGDFTSFFMEVSANSYSLLFPVICTSHSKFVKPLQAQVRSVNFTNFCISFLAGFYNMTQLCGGGARIEAAVAL